VTFYFVENFILTTLKVFRNICRIIDEEVILRSLFIVNKIVTALLQ